MSQTTALGAENSPLHGIDLQFGEDKVGFLWARLLGRPFAGGATPDGVVRRRFCRPRVDIVQVRGGWGFTTVALAIVGGMGQARGSGFSLSEQSARALGRASAVTAATDEPAAVWFNPAALTGFGAPVVGLSGALVHHGTRFSPADGREDVNGKAGFSGVPSVFVAAPVWGRVAAGFGAYVPFGLAVDWPEGWEGKHHALATRIWALALNPVLAVRLPGRVSVAAGGSLVRSGVRFRTALPNEVGGDGELSGETWGGAWNAAVLWKARPGVFHLGATYRSRCRLSFAGHADFSPATEGNATVPAEIFQDQGATSAITLPDVLTVGVMARVHPNVVLTADVQKTRWSTFDRLVVRFEKGSTPTTIIDRRTGNPWTFRLGGEWTVPGRRWVARAGALFDQRATPSDTLNPSTPDANRLGLTMGAGLPFGRMTVDVGYMFLRFLPSTATGCVKTVGGVPDPLSGSRCPPQGTYNTQAHVLALGLTWRFDRN